MLESEIMIVGMLTAYERVEHPDWPGRFSHAELTYRVDETLKGEVPDEVEALWYNGTFGVPESVRVGERRIVGLTTKETEEGATVYSIKQLPCSSPVSFPASPGNVEVVKGWLASGNADLMEIDYSADLKALEKAENPGASEKKAGETEGLSQRDWSQIALVSLAVFGALAVGAFLWRRADEAV